MNELRKTGNVTTIKEKIKFIKQHHSHQDFSSAKKIKTYKPGSNLQQ